MANIIELPLLSDTMEEGVIADVFFEKGDKISGGDILAEVETDKATMEVQAYDDHEGVLLHIASSGDTIPVGGVLAITGEEGEDVEAILKEHQNNQSTASEDKSDEDSSEEDESEETDIDEDEESGSTEGAQVIKMPLLSDTMEEGIIADVLVSKGDMISAGDILAEVETDKATMEVEAYDEHEGELFYIASSGDAIPVGGVLAITGEKGASIDVDAVLKEAKSDGEKKESKKESSDDSSQAERSDDQSSTQQSETSTSSETKGGRIKASPLAKKMAEEEDLDIRQIAGTGDGGRIIKRDIEKAMEEGVTKQTESTEEQSSREESGFVAYAPTGEEAREEVKVTQMRKTIAKRLAESKYSSPHFYLTMELNMDQMMAARKQMNELSPTKISFNDLIMKAAAMALRQHPQVNASWQGDKIVVNKHVHIGMAVAVDEGLLVPVLRFADNMPLSKMAETTGELANKARNGKLSLDEMQGSTFSVSNLGAMGIEEFTAIINPPNAAILAVGGINKRMREQDGEMKPTNVMKVTLSCDHRVVDGYVGSQYLQTLKSYVENPSLMLV